MGVQDEINKTISIGGEETTVFEIMSLFRSEGSCEPTVREALVRMADEQEHLCTIIPCRNHPVKNAPDYERGYADGHHEATEDYLRYGGEAQRKIVASRAAKTIYSNIDWLEDQAAQRSVVPDIEAMILRSFSDDNQEGN